MHKVKEKLEIDEVLEKKISNLLKFNNMQAKIENRNIIRLTNTNIAYIEPHSLEIKGITYLFFNECEDVYMNDLSRSIPLKELEHFIKCTF